MSRPIDCRIIENALLARLAARVLGGRAAAMVIGRRLLLWGVPAQAFLDDVRWRRHEACHVLQYHRYGLAGFLLRYAWQTLRHGYRHNALEAEARAASDQPGFDDRVHFHP